MSSSVGPDPSLQLIIEDEEGQRTVVPLARDEITIGRKDGNTIRLTERNVSRFHARLLRQEKTVFIEDLNSYTGVRINGDRISGRVEIHEGDLIEIGDYHLALQHEGAEGLASDESTEAARQATAPPPEETVKMQIEPLPEATVPAAAAAEATVPHAMPPAEETLKQEVPPAVQMTPPQPRAEPTALIRPEQMEATAPAAAPGEIPPPERASLVVVATILAGQRFELSHFDTVLGRVDDNTVVLDHRSVSRNHAKIVYDGQKYTVIDLKSANGVLVNGEEYSQTVLRPGDILELGHVQLRFVEPGGHFELSAEDIERIRSEAEQLEHDHQDGATLGTERFDRGEVQAELAKRSRWIIAGVAAAMVLLLMLILVLLFSGSKDSETSTHRTSPQAAGQPVPSPAQPSRPQAVRPAPVQLDDEQVAARLAKAKKALDEARFKDADQAVTSVLRARPQNQPAKKLADAIIRERRAKEDYQAGLANEEARRLEDALLKLEAVPEGTLFRERAVKRASVVRQKLVEDLYSRANQAFAEDDFDQAQQLISSGLELNPQHRRLIKLRADIEKLKSRLAGVDDPTPPVAASHNNRKPRGNTRKPKNRPKQTRKQLKPADAKNLYQKGNRFILQGRFRDAIDHFKQALKADPSFADAHRGLGIAYARLGRNDQAVRHYELYVKKRPNAQDADKVRQIIKAYRSSR